MTTELPIHLALVGAMSLLLLIEWRHSTVSSRGVTIVMVVMTAGAILDHTVAVPAAIALIAAGPVLALHGRWRGHREHLAVTNSVKLYLTATQLLCITTHSVETRAHHAHFDLLTGTTLLLTGGLLALAATDPCRRRSRGGAMALVMAAMSAMAVGG